MTPSVSTGDLVVLITVLAVPTCVIFKYSGASRSGAKLRTGYGTDKKARGAPVDVRPQRQTRKSWGKSRHAQQDARSVAQMVVLSDADLLRSGPQVSAGHKRKGGKKGQSACRTQAVPNPPAPASHAKPAPAKPTATKPPPPPAAPAAAATKSCTRPADKQQSILVPDPHAPPAPYGNRGTKLPGPFFQQGSEYDTVERRSVIAGIMAWSLTTWQAVVGEYLGICGLQRVAVRADGNCLWRAIAVQLYGEEALYQSVKSRALKCLRLNKLNFFKQSQATYDQHRKMAQLSGEQISWGGYLELNGIANAFNVVIHVLQQAQGNRPMRYAPDHLTDADCADNLVHLVVYFRDNNHFDAVVVKGQGPAAAPAAAASEPEWEEVCTSSKRRVRR